MTDTPPRSATPEPRFPVRIKVYGGGRSLLPPGTEWLVERTTEHQAPRGLVGEPMTEWTLIDLLPVEARSVPPSEPCVYCNDTRWTEDENWSPAYPESWDGSRSPGDGLIPCGGCNEGGWETRVGAVPPSEPPAMDVERLTEAMDYEREEALAIIRKHGFRFATDPGKPLDELTDAERWEKLAFTLYTMLLPSNRRSQRIAAEYAALRPPAEDPTDE